MKRIKITYEIITEESAEDGDVAERGWKDEEGKEIENVSDAITFIISNNALEPSSSQFHKGVWYTAYGDMDFTGEVENYSYHLEGFTENEEKEIYNVIIKYKGLLP